MPSTSMKLAWAIPVPVVEFGARLEAYCRVRLAIRTLRLCNRYGQGKKAAVTKLPVELVEHIASYMIEFRQAQRVEEWRRCLKCWEDQCTVTDHFEDEDLLEIYNDQMLYLHEDFDDEWQPKTKVTADVIKFCAEYIQDDDEAEHERFHSGDQHDINFEEWLGLIANIGRSTTYGAVLRKDFGLELFIGHTQGDRRADKESRQGSTIAYLHLPDAWSFEDSCVLDREESEWGYRTVETQQTFAAMPMIPAAPSRKSLARFSRAVKILGLPINVELAGYESRYKEKKDETDGVDKQEEELSGDHVVRPELRLLTKIDVEEEQR